jgi:osmotically-inducible protein OsmY
VTTCGRPESATIEGAPTSEEVRAMRQGLPRFAPVLALVCAGGLTLYGCNRDYESDRDDTTTDQYGDTAGTGTDAGALPMDKGADDSGIKDRVQAQLHNDARFKDVDIDIDDGIVTIDGQVANEADLEAVKQLVMQTQGVRDVKLNVQIDSSMDPNPNDNQ